jgi:hypothetical protein
MVSSVEEILIKIGINYEEISQKARRIRSTINKTFQNINKQESFANKHVSSIDAFTNRVTKGAIPASQRLSEQLQKNETRFQGWAMSVMFFGMAIQRVFMSIWKQSSQVFNDVMHSTEGTVTAFDMLQGSLKYLWFTIGEALSPLAEELIPIVLRVQEWVEENESLTRSLVKNGIIIGTFLFLVGTLVLGFNGLWTAIKNIGTIIKFAFVTDPIVGMIAGIILAITWIGLLAAKMGGIGEFLKSMVRGVLRVVVVIAEGLAWVFGKIGEGFVWVINKVIDGINWLIEKMNKIPGVNIGTIGKLEVSTAGWGDTFLRDYLDWEASSFLAPKQGYAEFGGLTPDYNNQQPQQITLKLDESETRKLLDGEEVLRGFGSMN